MDNDTFITEPLRDPSNGAIIRPPQRIDGFRLVDARASYGIGLETFALGFPVHFDWSYRTLFNKEWENYLFGSSELCAQAASSACGSGTTFRTRM